jgi:hypothetical protein
MEAADVYVDLDGHSLVLAGLDGDERRLIGRLAPVCSDEPELGCV